MNKTFQLGGQQFTEGDKLLVTTPELGALEVSPMVRSFSKDKVVALDFGGIKGPCLNSFTFYSNGYLYHTLQLAYLCRCPHHAHPRSMEWFGLTIEGNQIIAGRAREAEPLPPLEPVPEPTPAPVVESNQFPTTPKVEAQPDEPNIDMRGQFNLF